MADDVAATLPPGLHSTVTRLLAARTEERPEGARELVDRVRELTVDALVRDGLLPHPGPQPTKAQRRRKRRWQS